MSETIPASSSSTIDQEFDESQSSNIFFKFAKKTYLGFSFKKVVKYFQKKKIINS
jgi:hypothetical protein